MSSLNQVQIIGRLGQDPEVRQLNSGESVCSLRVATSKKWKDKNTGEAKEATEWHTIVLFGRLAEVAGQYLHKGSLAFFQGELKTRKWTDRDGIERYTTEIIANEMKMLSSANRDGNGGQQQSGQRPAAQQRQQASRPAARQSHQFDNDVPF